MILALIAKLNVHQLYLYSHVLWSVMEQCTLNIAQLNVCQYVLHPICQTYCSSNIPRIRYIRKGLMGKIPAKLTVDVLAFRHSCQNLYQSTSCTHLRLISYHRLDSAIHVSLNPKYQAIYDYLVLTWQTDLSRNVKRFW